MMHEEHEARLVRRIENFSDLVMGFSLALLSLTLVVPAHTVVLFAHPWWLVGYFWTFSFIAGIWYTHQRLFEKYFVPSGISILVNFVMLSMLGLVVYFVQVVGRVHTDADKALAFLAYFTAFSIGWIAIGTLYAIGTKKRWSHLSLEDRRLGVRRATRGIVLGASLICALIYDALTMPVISLDAAQRIATIVIPAMIGLRIVLHFVEPRILVPPVAESATV
jgi:uncharacterized membrane protein